MSTRSGHVTGAFLARTAVYDGFLCYDPPIRVDGRFSSKPALLLIFLFALNKRSRLLTGQQERRSLTDRSLTACFPELDRQQGSRVAPAESRDVGRVWTGHAARDEPIVCMAGKKAKRRYASLCRDDRPGSEHSMVQLSVTFSANKTYVCRDSNAVISVSLYDDTLRTFARGCVWQTSSGDSARTQGAVRSSDGLTGRCRHMPAPNG